MCRFVDAAGNYSSQNERGDIETQNGKDKKVTLWLSIEMKGTGMYS